MTPLATGFTSALAAGRYLQWGVLSISLTNFLIVVAMLVVFALALILPFPGHHPPTSTPPAKHDGGEDGDGAS
jgi:hypothetical protein